MDGSFITAIKELVRPDTYEVGGITFDAKKGAPIAMPSAAPLATTTLASLRDYMEGNLDGLDPKQVVAHIIGPDMVVLRSMLDATYRQREAYAKAETKGGRFEFGEHVDLEEFIVKLQGLFIDSGDRSNILQVVGNLSDGQVRTVDDNGVTQTVNTKVGVTQRAESKVPNPVTLTPYRTFPDVEQPTSKFIFRMQTGRGSNPLCALFEADNGAWRAVALANIRAWLLKNLPKGVTVLS